MKPTANWPEQEYHHDQGHYRADDALTIFSSRLFWIELFLAAIAACMIKGIERVAPLIHFKFRGVEVAFMRA